MTTPGPARSRFGAYEILHELSSGGMGAVLIGRRRGPGAFEQLVAIKTIRPEFAASAAVRAMFLDEAAILARLGHPSIATVHDFGEEGGSLYMVMEYVAGIPFRDLIEHRPPPTVIARAIAEAARGLHAAHELRDLSGAHQGLVHRDISPDNLLLGYDGHVKVIDFGIALVKKNRQAPVTELGTIKGKPPYMSPEQVKNEPMDRRSDVFSLGVVLWELLTKQPLFQGDSIYTVAIAVQDQPIVPPSQIVGAALPPGLDAAVMAALERDPARRTPTAAALAEQLEQAAQAGDGESLEAWAEHALRGAREQHRSWLAQIAGGATLPRAIGRATGQLTEVGPLPLANTTPVRPVEEAARPADVPLPADGPPGTTSEHVLEERPRRSQALVVVVLGVLALVLVATAILVSTRDRSPARGRGALATTGEVNDSATHDAMPAQVDDAAAAVVALDATAAPVDGGGGRDPIRTDAGVRRVPVLRDAGTLVAPVARDAASVTPPAAGVGTVTIRYKPGVYANISIDGGPAVPGPLIKRKLAAGPHTITFLDPKSGDVLDTQSVRVEPDAHLDVLQR